MNAKYESAPISYKVIIINASTSMKWNGLAFLSVLLNDHFVLRAKCSLANQITPIIQRVKLATIAEYECYVTGWLRMLLKILGWTNTFVVVAIYFTFLWMLALDSQYDTK